MVNAGLFGTSYEARLRKQVGYWSQMTSVALLDCYRDYPDNCVPEMILRFPTTHQQLQRYAIQAPGLRFTNRKRERCIQLLVHTRLKQV